MNSDELCQLVKRKYGPKVVLAFSGGKDAVASWIQLRRHDIEVVPMYHYVVPGLEFVEDTLNYYEKIFGQEIHRYPGPAFSRSLGEGLFATKASRRVVVSVNPYMPTRDDLFDDLRDDEDMDENALVALGIRAADNHMRAAGMKKTGGLNLRERKFYPVWDWSHQRLIDEINAAGIKLSVDYEMFGRSFEGMSDRFLPEIRRRFPRDFERICRWFPLCWATVVRRRFFASGHQTQERR